MTTNKSDFKRYNITIDKCGHPVSYETEHGQWVKYSSYRAVQAECEKLRKDAERYRKLRSTTWDASPLCVVVDPKHSVQLGSDCPSHKRLDDIVDNLHVTTP